MCCEFGDLQPITGPLFNELRLSKCHSDLIPISCISAFYDQQQIY